MKPTQKALIKELTDAFKGFLSAQFTNGNLPTHLEISALSIGFAAALKAFGYSQEDAIAIIKAASEEMQDGKPTKNTKSNVQKGSKKVKGGGKVRAVRKGTTKATKGTE